MKRTYVLLPVGTIVRDSHHRKASARYNPGLNLCRFWVLAWSNKILQHCRSDNYTTTPLVESCLLYCSVLKRPCVINSSRCSSIWIVAAVCHQLTDSSQRFVVAFTQVVTDTTWRFILYSYIVAVVKVRASNLLAPPE